MSKNKLPEELTTAMQQAIAGREGLEEFNKALTMLHTSAVENFRMCAAKAVFDDTARLQAAQAAGIVSGIKLVMDTFNRLTDI